MSKTRAKGTRFENQVVEFLRANGFIKAKRLPFSSPLGDIHGTPMVIEAKDQKTMKLPEWLEQANKSGAKAGFLAAVIHKRVRKSIEKAYVTMELETFVKILKVYAETRPLFVYSDPEIVDE